LWFAAAGADDGANSREWVGFPTGYTAGHTMDGNEHILATVYRQASTATEDPSAFTMDGTETSILLTVAVPGTDGVAEDFSLSVDFASLVLSQENVTLLFGEAYVIPVTASSGVVEGQNLPFIYSNVAVDASVVAAGQEVSIIVPNSFLVEVEAAATVLAGQNVVLNTIYRISVDSGALVLNGSDVALVLPFVTGGSSGVDGRATRRRALRKILN
jgi:hypothetical protein